MIGPKLRHPGQRQREKQGRVGAPNPRVLISILSLAEQASPPSPGALLASSGTRPGFRLQGCCEAGTKHRQHGPKSVLCRTTEAPPAVMRGASGGPRTALGAVNHTVIEVFPCQLPVHPPNYTEKKCWFESLMPWMQQDLTRKN